MAFASISAALALLFLAPTRVVAQSSLAPSHIASVFGLASSTTLTFPTAVLNSADAVTYLSEESGWQISKNGHLSQPDDVSFVSDPIDTSNPSPVLAVLYPAGSFSNGTGGTSFSQYFNDSSPTDYRTVQLSYQVGFLNDFQFVKGGKLPGLRGGDIEGCDGGVNSASCFSTRFMWRTSGAGEAYAYIQDTDICSESNVICNDSGFGTSVGRGTFTFATGAWNQLDMIVGFNNPVGVSNGYIAVYHDGVLAINETGLQIRSNSSVANIQGMFFSTFFGGDDSSWATPTAQSTFYRNFRLFGSDSASTLTTKSSGPLHLSRLGLGVIASVPLLLCTLLETGVVA